MIKVNIHENDDGQIVAFNMTGHADFDEYGKDIVCAGASAVVFGNVNAIISMTDADPDIDLEDDGGYLDVRIKNPDDEKLQTILGAMIVSLKTIEEEYNEYIRIKYM